MTHRVSSALTDGPILVPDTSPGSEAGGIYLPVAWPVWLCLLRPPLWDAPDSSASSGEGVPLTKIHCGVVSVTFLTGICFVVALSDFEMKSCCPSIRKITWNKTGRQVWGPGTHPASLLHQLSPATAGDGKPGLTSSQRLSEILGCSPGFWECNIHSWVVV